MWSVQALQVEDDFARVIQSSIRLSPNIGTQTAGDNVLTYVISTKSHLDDAQANNHQPDSADYLILEHASSMMIWLQGEDMTR